MSKHLDFIRGLSCALCGNNTAIQAAHIRMVDRRVAKPITGMGTKPPDCWTVPLCGECHSLQHGGGERGFWEAHGIDPIFVAMALFIHSGDHLTGERILEALRGL